MKTLIYPIIALIFSVFAHFFPEIFTPFKDHIVTFLMIIMLGMGMTLNFTDIVSISSKKSAIILGVTVQFIFMPLIALGISIVFELSQALTIGMVLVGTSAGGTASNVLTYLAKGDLALSVSMTLASTVISCVLMPFLTCLYLGKSVEVAIQSMLFDLIKITILPLVIGIFLNTFFSKFLHFFKRAMPLISMSAIIFIVAVIVALNTQNLSTVGISVIIAVIVHNTLGMFCGYASAIIFGFDTKTARTLAIEVGVQNSGLSAALAMKYFGVISALPAALFSIIQNVIGALFASICKKTEI
ncbi:bile acid:sodium symporter family protein [Campylobacter sp. 9BO]|uniref:bile acid:sodium symporter family protein n=1 Tax=Campylobacter sp. 9BO TaxID=3424759 RepID=UPI003D344694